jgi:DNA-binding FadR family transcriptional regulator
MERRYREVADELLDEIVTGENPEGARLPDIAALTGRFGVSRGVIREALRALEERGLISTRSGRGHTIEPDDRWDVLDLDVLEAMVFARGDTALLLEMLEAIRLAETHSGAIAARRARDGDLSLLASAVGRMHATAGRPGAGHAVHPFAIEHAAFHRDLMLIAGNRVLARLTDPLIEVVAAMMYERAPEHAPALVRHHERILAALRARDERATQGALDAYARQMGRWLAR